MSRSSFKTFRPKTLIVLIALACIAGASAWLAAAPTPQVAPAQPAVAQSETVKSASATSKKEVLPSIAVTLTRRGFEPGDVTMSASRFFLTVENRSEHRGLTLLIDPEHGNRVREFTEPEDELDWTDELHLTPGRYTLAVTGHPDWVCHIIVTAQ